MQRAPVVLIAISILLLFAAPIRAEQNEDGGPDTEAPSQPRSQPSQSSSARRDRQAEMSSSKDTRIDLSPPADDAKKHPDSGAAMVDAAADDDSGVSEMKPWDPHKAAKDVEVGDFYYKRKNYRAAIERYKDALVYKPNDAVATFRLAECQDKTGETAEAVTHYEDYLKILPQGPYAEDAHKALDRLTAKGPSTN